MSDVDINRETNVVTATMRAADRRNALDLHILEAIRDAAAQASDALVLVLTGEGPTFCAGFNVNMMKRGADAVDALVESLSQTCRALRRCPATVLVDVQGAAIAGGCALAVTADVLIARRGSVLGYPVHALGISPAVTIPVLLPAAGGLARTLLMGGEIHTADSLFDHGLVHHLLDIGEDRTPIIDRLRSRGTEAAHTTKKWLNELDGADDDAAFDGPVQGSRGLSLIQPD
ncbi:MAG: enoyl-CoA hydratase/isomerase family protein [Planctomycetes bacterium]|jgi:enoyl-CoA hydratase/carnithine racemase|nr:enoyl-CoA hydratase/isomerase family protein [Planctomycetota bacterium]MCP4839938.1 enoyl-CoA hydratase/isomerase family protein [Planctomycetota bacterium]